MDSVSFRTQIFYVAISQSDEEISEIKEESKIEEELVSQDVVSEINQELSIEDIYERYCFLPDGTTLNFFEEKRDHPNIADMDLIEHLQLSLFDFIQNLSRHLNGAKGESKSKLQDITHELLCKLINFCVYYQLYKSHQAPLLLSNVKTALIQFLDLWQMFFEIIPVSTITEPILEFNKNLSYLLCNLYTPNLCKFDLSNQKINSYNWDEIFNIKILNIYDLHLLISEKINNAYVNKLEKFINELPVPNKDSVVLMTIHLHLSHWNLFNHRINSFLIAPFQNKENIKQHYLQRKYSGNQTTFLRALFIKLKNQLDTFYANWKEFDQTYHDFKNKISELIEGLPDQSDTKKYKDFLVKIRAYEIMYEHGLQAYNLKTQKLRIFLYSCELKIKTYEESSNAFNKFLYEDFSNAPIYFRKIDLWALAISSLFQECISQITDLSFQIVIKSFYFDFIHSILMTFKVIEKKHPKKINRHLYTVTKKVIVLIQGLEEIISCLTENQIQTKLSKVVQLLKTFKTLNNFGLRTLEIFTGSIQCNKKSKNNSKFLVDFLIFYRQASLIIDSRIKQSQKELEKCGQAFKESSHLAPIFEAIIPGSYELLTQFKKLEKTILKIPNDLSQNQVLEYFAENATTLKKFSVFFNSPKIYGIRHSITKSLLFILQKETQINLQFLKDLLLFWKSIENFLFVFSYPFTFFELEFNAALPPKTKNKQETSSVENSKKALSLQRIDFSLSNAAILKPQLLKGIPAYQASLREIQISSGFENISHYLSYINEISSYPNLNHLPRVLYWILINQSILALEQAQKVFLAYHPFHNETKTCHVLFAPYSNLNNSKLLRSVHDVHYLMKTIDHLGIEVRNYNYLTAFSKVISTSSRFPIHEVDPISEEMIDLERSIEEKDKKKINKIILNGFKSCARISEQAFEVVHFFKQRIKLEVNFQFVDFTQIEFCATLRQFHDFFQKVKNIKPYKLVFESLSEYQTRKNFFCIARDNCSRILYILNEILSCATPVAIARCYGLICYTFSAQLLEISCLLTLSILPLKKDPSSKKHFIFDNSYCHESFFYKNHDYSFLPDLLKTNLSLYYLTPAMEKLIVKLQNISKREVRYLSLTNGTFAEHLKMIHELSNFKDAISSSTSSIDDLTEIKFKYKMEPDMAFDAIQTDLAIETEKVKAHTECFIESAEALLKMIFSYSN